METYGAFEDFAGGEDKYCIAFGRDIIDSIPPGSIYFGGTDPGRFLVTALCKSQVNADPFFMLTQNALADGGYLAYLRGMYGDKIYIPTDPTRNNVLRTTRRMSSAAAAAQTQTGREFQDGQWQSSSQRPGFRHEINGLLAKIIFDKNPDHEFYIEESFPLDWMYPYLEPHGLIMKINRQPLSELSDDIVSQDHDYWTKYVTPMIGGWLNDDTPVSEVAAFAEKVHLRHNLSGFTGDPRFVQNDYCVQSFSKLRSSIAGIYAWRAGPRRRRGGKGPHGPRGGFRLPAGLGALSDFARGRVSIHKFPSETESEFRRPSGGFHLS